MPVGSELAALFEARRLKSESENDAADDNDNAGAPQSNASDGDSFSPLGSAEGPLSSVPQSSVVTSAATTVSGATAGRQTPILPRTESTLDNTNTEDGIPTPAFLLNARKNLKSANIKTVGGDGGPGGGSCGGGDARGIGNASENPFQGKRIGINNASVKGGDKLSSKEITINGREAKATKNATNNEGAPLDETNANSNGSDFNSIKAAARINRRHARSNSQSNATTNLKGSPTNEGELTLTPKPLIQTDAQTGKEPLKTPSYLRRERLMAKVMSQRVTSPRNSTEIGNSSGDNSQYEDDNRSFDSNKIRVTSPRVDEVELLFADANIDSDNISVDSIADELYALQSTSTGSTTTLPTNNVQKNPNNSQETISKNNEGKIFTTPEKAKGPMSQQQRLHLASTPKIRGNYQHRRDKFNEREGGQNMQPLVSPNLQQQQHQPQQLQRSPKQHQQPIYHYQQEGEAHNIHQAYTLQERAPSAISQISAISTPSCFPADLPTTLGHLQQPVLGGGVSGMGGGILSSPSFGNTSTTSGVSGMPSTPMQGGMGGSAFSPGVEAENRRLRDQLSTVQQKLDEKDAIISQLMKRISDLEASRIIQSESLAMSALWDHSQPAFHTSGGIEGYSQFPTRTNSADESAISTNSSSNPHPINSFGVTKQSPNTAATSSTASVTTSSSKSRDIHHSHSRSHRTSSSAAASRRKESSSKEIKRSASQSSHQQSPSHHRSTSGSSRSSQTKKKRSPNRDANQNGNDRVFMC